jgi:hypothetical protein
MPELPAPLHRYRLPTRRQPQQEEAQQGGAQGHTCHGGVLCMLEGRPDGLAHTGVPRLQELRAVHPGHRPEFKQ